MSFGCDSSNNPEVFTEEQRELKNLQRQPQSFVNFDDPISNNGEEIKQRKESNSRQKTPQRVVLRSICDNAEERFMRCFFQGALIYRKGTSEEVLFPISALTNALDGVFDLSRCNGKENNYICIRTGCREQKVTYTYADPGYGNSRIVIWLCPRFLIERKMEVSK